MEQNRKTPGLTALLICALLFLMSAYFTFAAVQGDFGIFRRVQVTSEITDLKIELENLNSEIGTMQNKTERLSDGFLDLDLLDHQARKVLGLMRADEVLTR